MFDAFLNGTGYRKKASTFLAIAGVIAAALVLVGLSRARGADGNGLIHASGDTGAVEDANCEEQGSTVADGYWFGGDPNLSVGSGEGPGMGELFAKMLLMVLVVVGLGVAAMYLTRKYGVRMSRSTGKEIQFMETAYLGPRKMVHLVKVGMKRLLIGSTNENMTTLADVTDALDIIPYCYPEVGSKVERTELFLEKRGEYITAKSDWENNGRSGI